MTQEYDAELPVHITGRDRSGPWLITCDHATNRVPADLVPGGDLGLPASDMQRHIAFDPGARGVALALGEMLDSPVVSSNFSRLVIDPNRGDDDPTLIMQLYDGSIIPANRNLDDAARQARIDACYAPYHAALRDVGAEREDPVILSIHSFTPQLAGRPKRPWHIGVLYADDTRLTDPLIAALSEDADICVGANQPYTGFLGGDAIDQHALRHGRLNTLIELRNDLIQTPDQQRDWAARLVAPLTAALSHARNSETHDG